ncbi:MAG TPA: GNAT family N-acetyltransferase, partial [Chitinophagaceae bacterium]|nr:GNAT family N-acetyltransferase [Chitinophagaceae bacterium]
VTVRLFLRKIFIMSLEFIYKKANINDLCQLKQLAIISYEQFKEVLSVENCKKMDLFLTNDDTFIQLIQKSVVFVCAKNETIIGVAYLVPSGNATPIFDDDWCYVRMVGVNPEYRGRGIAKQLTQMCIEYAKNAGEKIIALHTSEFMNTAKHIYESIGFVRTKELDPIFDKKYWLYKLEL